MTLVVGHRGASAYRPEHTLVAYELAARLGADLLELDLVATRDHVLVARHENNLAGTTDVADHPEFADRATVKVVDGMERRGWFTEDFTLEEVKTLRATERVPLLRPGNTEHDGQEPIVTLAEALDLRERLSAELGREVMLYPEIKHSAHFAGLGLPIEPALMELLMRHDQNRPDGQVLVHAFELGSLLTLHNDLGMQARSSFLLWPRGGPPEGFPGPDDRVHDSAFYTTPPGLRLVREAGISGVSPELTMVVSRNDDGSVGEDTGLVSAAHAEGLWVHPFTFRAENHFLFTDFRSSDDPRELGDLEAQVHAFLQVGIDAVNTDHPDLGVAAVRSFGGR